MLDIATKLSPASRCLATSLIAWVTLILLPTTFVGPVRAQDEAMEKLLDQLDEKPPSAGQEAARNDSEKPQVPGEPDELSPDDADLDSLLEKLGNEASDVDQPETKGRSQPGDPAASRSTENPSPDSLEGADRDLDRRLEEMVRRKKPESSPDQAQEDSQSSDDSPLGQAIKKMEEARQRLAQQDTGAETRKTQDQVVEQLDQVLEQMRRSQAQRQAERQQRLSMRTRQAGQQPGQQPGQPNESPGNTAQGVGPQAPRKPTVNDVLVGAKDTWGDLPPHLREEMENVFREEMLPAKRELIIRYYSTVARQSRDALEGN